MKKGMLLKRSFALLVTGVLLGAACGGPNTDTEPNAASEAVHRGVESEAIASPAPEFPEGLTWFNVFEPMSFADLRGKIVLLDFWTQGCINCQHILPDLARLEREFPDSLVVIGVHTGKYSEEQKDSAVAEAIARYGLEHPVVNDPNRIVWRQWGVHAWPTLILIDPRGNIVTSIPGEGVYEKFHPLIQDLYNEFTTRGLINPQPILLNLEAQVASSFLSFPSEVLADEQGDRLFIADAGHDRIVITNLNGQVLTTFGAGKPGFADGNPKEAHFRAPQGLELSPDGNTLWVADTRNHAIRAINLLTGQVTTIAGNGSRGYQRFHSGDPLKSALASPWDIHHHDGSLYIANAGTHQIWVLNLETNYLEVFAGTRYENIDDGHRLKDATLAQPSGLTGDKTYLYWVDAESSSVRRVPFEGKGKVETLVGSDLFEWGDVDGPANEAQIQHPQGLVLSDGVVYLADTYNHKIRALSLIDSWVTTIAGSGQRGWKDGDALKATFKEPNSLSLVNNKLYLADSGNHALRIIDLSSGEVRTLQFSNLASALPNIPEANTLLVQLPTQVVAPGTSTLLVSFYFSKDYHFTAATPSHLKVSPSKHEAVILSETLLTWSTDETSFTVPILFEMIENEVEITATGVIYFCRTGKEALCLIQPVQLVAPIQVSTTTTEDEVLVEYMLPAIRNRH